MSDSKIVLLANLFKVFRFGSARKDFDIELGRSVCHDGLEITISRSDLKLRRRTLVNQCSQALIRCLYTGLFNGVVTLENKEAMSDSKIDLLANLFKMFRFGSARKDFDIES